MKQPIPHAKAQAAAAQIVAALKPFCAQIEIAGSIRRGLPLCGDIDLVCLPTDRAALRDRIVTNKEVIQDGEQNIYVRLGNGIELNVYVAHPEQRDFFSSVPCNFGSLLLCRTGPREFNIGLIEHAKKMGNGVGWNPQHGVFFEGKCVAAATEEEIFAALDLNFIPPVDRDKARVAGWFPFAAFKR